MQLSPGKATRTGDPVQVSRLGNPLVNEVVLPAGLKDAFNGLTPSKDATIPEVVARVTDPELPEAHRGDLRRAGSGGPAQRPGRDLPDRDREGRADARRLGRADPGRPEQPRAQRRQGPDPALGDAAAEHLDQADGGAEPARRARRRPAGLPERTPARRRRHRHLDPGRRGCRADRQAGRRAGRRRQGGRQRRRLLDAVPVRRAAGQRDGGRRPGRRRPSRRTRWRDQRQQLPTVRRAPAEPPARGAETTEVEVQPTAASSAWTNDLRRCGWPAGSARWSSPERWRCGSAAVAPRSGRTGPRSPAATPTETGCHGLHRPPRHRAVPAAVACCWWPRSRCCCWSSVIAAGLDDSSRDTPAGTPQPVPDRLAATIAQAQERLRRVPGDAGTWAALGSAYVEQARVSGNPAYYAQAQGALDRSTQLQPTGNAAAAVGLGALANARHDFAAARGYAEQALAGNPASMEANGVLADAATQLGDTATATAAVQRMLELRPGVAAFTRASYELELHGRVDEARVALERALGAATSRDELAFCQYYLGELAWGGGDLEEARAHYERGLAAAPGDPALLHGRAKVLAAAGRVDEAITALRPADAAGAAAAVPARVRRAAGVGRPAARRPVPVPAPRRAAAALRRAGLGRRRDRRAAGRRSRRPRRGGPAGRGRVVAPAEHLLRRGAGLGAARGRPGRRGAAADRAGRGTGPAGRDGRLPPRDDPGPAGSRSHRRGDRRAGRGAGHQPALLPAARARRPADPGDPAGCGDDPLGGRAAGRRCSRCCDRRRCWRSDRPAARPRIRWATSR